jgi:hypothetical protein
MIQELQAHQEAQTLPDEQALVRCDIRYLSHRIHCLDYPKAIAPNLPIGSGLIESAHKHVIQARDSKRRSHRSTPHSSRQ